MSEGKGSFFIFLSPSSSLSSSSNSTNPQKRRTMSLSIALVPFAPLLALPPRMVAAAASCACLLGGAALGVARVRAAGTESCRGRDRDLCRRGGFLGHLGVVAPGLWRRVDLE